MEQAIDQIGFGKFQIKLSILTGFAWVSSQHTSVCVFDCCFVVVVFSILVFVIITCVCVLTCVHVYCIQYTFCMRACYMHVHVCLCECVCV